MNPILKAWHVTSRQREGETVYYAYGTVYGHTSYRCQDGTFIHISRIQRITEADENTLEIITRNTNYQVKLNEYGTLINIEDAAAGNDYSTSYGDFTENALKHFDVSPGVYQKLTELRKERFEKRNSLIKSCDEKLSDGEIYLALSADADNYFDFGAVKLSNEIVPLRKILHVGMVTDSVLLGNDKSGIVARYFPFSMRNIEFYHDLYSDFTGLIEGTRLGYLKNTGDMPLFISFSWGRSIELGAGEEIEVLYEVTGSKKS